jgi:AcrR family transcriptional regulator
MEPMNAEGSARDDADERRRVVDAAWRVLDRSGFQGLKVRSVLKAVPTSASAFYRLFEDKDDLAVELICAEYRRAGRRLEAAMGDAAPADALRLWIEAYLASATDPSLADRTRLFASLRNTMPRASHRVSAAVDDFLAPLSRMIDEGARAGVFRTTDPASDAIAINHLCAGVLLDLTSTGDPVSEDVAVAGLERVVGFAGRALGI